MTTLYPVNLTWSQSTKPNQSMMINIKKRTAFFNRTNWIQSAFDIRKLMKKLWKMWTKKNNVSTKTLILILVYVLCASLVNGTDHDTTDYVNLDTLPKQEEKLNNFKLPAFYYSEEKKKFYIFDWTPRLKMWVIFYEDENKNLSLYATHLNSRGSIRVNQNHPELPILFNEPWHEHLLYPVNQLFNDTDFKRHFMSIRNAGTNDTGIKHKLEFLKLNSKQLIKERYNYYDKAVKIVKLQKLINEIKDENHVLTLEQLKNLDSTIKDISLDSIHREKMKKLQKSKFDALETDIHNVIPKKAYDRKLREEIQQFVRVFGAEDTKKLSKPLDSIDTQNKIANFQENNKYLKNIKEAIELYRHTYGEDDQESMKQLAELTKSKYEEIQKEISKLENKIPVQKDCTTIGEKITKFESIFEKKNDEKFSTFKNKCGQYEKIKNDINNYKLNNETPNKEECETICADIEKYKNDFAVENDQMFSEFINQCNSTDWVLSSIVAGVLLFLCILFIWSRMESNMTEHSTTNSVNPTKILPNKNATTLLQKKKHRQSTSRSNKSTLTKPSSSKQLPDHVQLQPDDRVKHDSSDHQQKQSSSLSSQQSNTQPETSTASSTLPKHSHGYIDESEKYDSSRSHTTNSDQTQPTSYNSQDTKHSLSVNNDSSHEKQTESESSSSKNNQINTTNIKKPYQ